MDVGRLPVAPRRHRHETGLVANTVAEAATINSDVSRVHLDDVGDPLDAARQFAPEHVLLKP